MASIVSGDIGVSLTGATSDGGAQTSPAASLGNYRSSTALGTGDGCLDPDTSGAEASAGHTDYLCLCFKNNHATLAAQAVSFYLTGTGASDDVVSIAVEVPTGGDSAGYAQTIASETTAPTVNAGNVSNWSTATTRATGVGVNQGAHDNKLDPGEQVFVWKKRVVTAGAGAVTAETYVVNMAFDTAA